MSKLDSVDQYYKKSTRVKKIYDMLYWINCILAIYLVFNMWVNKDWIITVQIILVILYMVLKSLDEGILWYDAEKLRRADCIQNALDIKLTEVLTVDYYNNNERPSIIKYGINTFESNFYSNFISKKMLVKSFLKSIFSVIVFIIALKYTAYQDVLLVIAQTIFSAYVIEEFVMLLLYSNNMRKIYDEAYIQLVTIGVKDSKQVGWLLSYAVEYEAIKAHYRIKLDSNVFKEYNEQLSEKWNNIQSKISVLHNFDGKDYKCQ